MDSEQSEKLYLSPADILEKVFKNSTGGYDPQEVDKYLDMIIRDYTTLINRVKVQRKDNEALVDVNNQLRQEVRNLREELEVLKTKGEEDKALPSNIDLLKRISNLEKVVFGKDE